LIEGDVYLEDYLHERDDQFMVTVVHFLRKHSDSGYVLI